MILTNHPSFFEEIGLTSFTTLQRQANKKCHQTMASFVNECLLFPEIFIAIIGDDAFACRATEFTEIWIINNCTTD